MVRDSLAGLPMETANRMKDYPTTEDLRVSTLCPCEIRSPYSGDGSFAMDDGDRILLTASTADLESLTARGLPIPCFEAAGPRPAVFANPEDSTCGIVTCGGLCPGINNVIRSITLTLVHGYGVRRVLGFRYGYAGLAPDRPAEPSLLTPEVVERIHEQGGSLLGSSRGPRDVGDMVAELERRRVSILFAIGGDGTLRGASALANEIARRGLRIAVVGVPKTIDNDIDWIDRSFGFATAVEEARRAIAAAHAEAGGAWNGIGLVKLMGRHSGFIAAHATLASNDVNFCLVPEIPLALDGPGGFLQALEDRLAARRHAVVVAAEGTAQDSIAGSSTPAHDPSGNVRLKDVGEFLRSRITTHFERRGTEITLKYIDPSYVIRSLPANTIDSELCLALGQHAVHAGMAGRTDVVIGHWNQRFVHVPIPVAVRRRRQIDPDGALWRRVVESTGQARWTGEASP